jgi:hypothetical protein
VTPDLEDAREDILAFNASPREVWRPLPYSTVD